MGIASGPITFSSGETIRASDHNTNYGNVYTEVNGNLDNNNIKALAGIVDTKLAQITTAAKVHGTSLTGLASVPSAAGAIPAVNLAAVYPVGSIYIETTGTNPATTFGFGTWSAFGAGRVIIGTGGGYTAGTTGGAATVTLTVGEMPAHTHPIACDGNYVGEAVPTMVATTSDRTYQGNLATVTTGGGGAHNNLQPYIVAYMWQRTA